MQCTNQISNKKWTPIKTLLLGNQLEWPIWRTLNRVRTGVGRTKNNLKKWGMLEETSKICECEIEWTMKHIMQCPIYPYSCSQEGVIDVNDNAENVARFWAKTI